MTHGSPKPALVFFDIDGTLIDSQRRVPETAAEAIGQLRQNGHLAIINTGRSFAGIGPEIRAVGFDGIVAGNGTFIQFRDETLHNQTIDPALLDELLPILEQSEIDVWLEGPEHIYFERLENPPINVAHYVEVFSVLPGVNRDWHQKPIVTNKMSYHLRPESRPEPALSLLRRHFTVVQKDPDPFGEVIPRGYSKATGMVFLLEHLGFSQEQTFAFGDSLNDIEMLTFAAHGIAMGGSRRTVLRVSDHVTGSAAENGIADALHHFGLI